MLDLYRPRVALEHPEAQYAYAREFIPGEPLASTAYRRRGSVTWVAAGVPAASASVGDRRGVLLGETCTATRRPVAWDPWMAQEVRRASGLTAVVGGLGSGKSFLTGLMVYKTLRAGARWTVLDPSGPLAALTRLPELAPFSRHIHLLGADPGILNPYRVVAEPRRDHFLDEPDPEKAWRRERSLAAATRRRLVLDVLTGLLPFDVARLPHTRIVLLRAVREVGGGQHRDPGQVIATLRRHAREGEEHADVVADFLEERRELPQAALLFPEHTVDPEDPRGPDDSAGGGATGDPSILDEEDYRLTVLTMQGMSLPRPGSPREEWTDGESLAVELLNLASWLTQRTVYTADRDLRKGVALDETHFLSQIPTGKVLIDRLARDSRKFNVRALFASQLAGDLLRVPGFASLVDAVFVGRTDDAEAQAEALRLLRVPTDVGYEEMLGTLSPRPTASRSLGDHDDSPDDTPRQFVFSDGHGGVEKIRVDLEGPHLAHLRAALDTNPDAQPRPPAHGARGAPRPRPASRATEHPGLGGTTAPGAAGAPTVRGGLRRRRRRGRPRAGTGRRRRVIVVVGILAAALVIGWRRGAPRGRGSKGALLPSDGRTAPFARRGWLARRVSDGPSLTPDVTMNPSSHRRRLRLPRTRRARALLVVGSLVGGLCSSAAPRRRRPSTARPRPTRTGPAPASSGRWIPRRSGSAPRAACTTRSVTPARSGGPTTWAADRAAPATPPRPPTPGWATSSSTSPS